MSGFVGVVCELTNTRISVLKIELVFIFICFFCLVRFISVVCESIYQLHFLPLRFYNITSDFIQMSLVFMGWLNAVVGWTQWLIRLTFHQEILFAEPTIKTNEWEAKSHYLYITGIYLSHYDLSIFILCTLQYELHYRIVGDADKENITKNENPKLNKNEYYRFSTSFWNKFATDSPTNIEETM